MRRWIVKKTCVPLGSAERHHGHNFLMMKEDTMCVSSSACPDHHRLLSDMHRYVAEIEKARKRIEDLQAIKAGLSDEVRLKVAGSLASMSEEKVEGLVRTYGVPPTERPICDVFPKLSKDVGVLKLIDYDRDGLPNRACPCSAMAKLLVVESRAWSRTRTTDDAERRHWRPLLRMWTVMLRCDAQITTRLRGAEFSAMSGRRQDKHLSTVMIAEVRFMRIE